MHFLLTAETRTKTALELGPIDTSHLIFYLSFLLFVSLFVCFRIRDNPELKLNCVRCIFRSMEPSMNSLMIKMCLTFETKKTFFLQECQDESRDVSESQDKETLEGASDNTGPRD